MSRRIEQCEPYALRSYATAEREQLCYIQGQEKRRNFFLPSPLCLLSFCTQGLKFEHCYAEDSRCIIWSQHSSQCGREIWIWCAPCWRVKTEELQDSVNDEGPVGRGVGRRRAQDLAMADKVERQSWRLTLRRWQRPHNFTKAWRRRWGQDGSKMPRCARNLVILVRVRRAEVTTPTAGMFLCMARLSCTAAKSRASLYEKIMKQDKISNAMVLGLLNNSGKRSGQ